MKRGRIQATDTVPKLDKVEYLFDTLVAINDGASLDEIRSGLIELRKEIDRRTKRDLRAELRPRARRLDNPLANTFWSNAREAVRELIKLGMVARKTVPSNSMEFANLRHERFQITSVGREFVKLGESHPWEFRDRFFCAMYSAHIYLREFTNRLAARELYIPRISRSEIPGDVDLWRKRPPEPLSDLVARITDSIRAANGQMLEPKQLEALLFAGLDKTWSRRSPTGDKKEISRWVVKMVNEQNVRAISLASGIGMDYIAFRHAVSLLNDLHICWDTRALARREEGWTIWLTAEGEPPEPIPHNTQAEVSPATLALQQAVWIRRRVPNDSDVLRATIETILKDPRKAGGFSLIHEIRASVCHLMHIHGWYFDVVLQKMFKSELQDSKYLPHFDAGGGDQLPASEDPFLVDDRQYFLVTIVDRRAA